ncbi:MAG: DUF1499 domain-containing protein [Deltaproteobacteria bacterium]|nr:DUF1499 domain-containing protein [Deltaproteobacteria bacterium]
MHSTMVLKMFISGTLILMTLSSCAGRKPDTVGVHNQQLSNCPDSPNCVSSTVQDQEHQIAPFHVKGKSDIIWSQLLQTIDSFPRCLMITKTDVYLHMECKSLIFRFVDDLELLLTPTTGIIDIRSASRLGKSDFGVNRKRVESLRQVLLNKGLIES